MSFQPFMTVDGVYNPNDPGQTRELILRGLTRLTGVHRRLMDKQFNDLISSTLARTENSLCCSSVRALLENRIAEIPAFKEAGLPVSSTRVLRETLAACDFLETVVKLWLEEKIRGTSAEYAAELETVDQLFNTTKLPGLLDSVIEKATASS